MLRPASFHICFEVRAQSVATVGGTCSTVVELSIAAFLLVARGDACCNSLDLRDLVAQHAALHVALAATTAVTGRLTPPCLTRSPLESVQPLLQALLLFAGTSCCWDDLHGTNTDR